MADEEIDYAQYAGRVSFPRGPQDLLSTSCCPACFTVLTSTICASCGLDLSHPAAAELHDASLAASAALNHRLAIIGRIRYESEPAASGRWAARQEAARDAATPPPLQPQRADVATPALVDPVRTEAPVLKDPHHRSSVQVTLLIVGVSLLSVAAIFFLVYAFINFGIVWRSVIIGAITIAAFVVATLLRRRKLTATAEGISAFGVVLVYLDAFAIRANNLFDAGSADGATFWGVTLVLAAIAFIAWHRMSALRIPNIAGFATVAPGAGLLVAGLTEQLGNQTQSFLAFTAIAVAGLIHGLAPRPNHPAIAERTIVLVTSVLGLVAGLFTAVFIYPNSPWAPAIAFMALAIIAAVHIGSLRGSDAGVTSAVTRTFSFIFAGFAGLAAASAFAACVPRMHDPTFAITVPAIAATVVALALESVFRRAIPGTLRTTGLIASTAAAIVVVFTTLPAVSVTLLETIRSAMIGVLTPWSLQPTDAVLEFRSAAGWELVTILIVGALAAAAWSISGRLRTRGPLLAAWAGLSVTVAVPFLHTQWLEVAAWLLVAIGCLIAILVIRPIARGYRAVLVTTMVVTALLGYLLSWSSTSTWWVATLVLIAILVASRSLVTNVAIRATLLGVAASTVLLSVGSVASQLTIATNTGLEGELADRFALTALVAVITVAISGLSIRIVSDLDRRVLFWIALAISGLSLAGAAALLQQAPSWLLDSLLLSEFGTSLITAAILLGGLVLWIALSANRPLSAERIVAAIAVSPTLYLLVTAFARVLNLPAFIDTVAPITAALLAAAGSLMITTLRPSTAPRWSRELGVVLVAIPALFSALLGNDDLAWLVLLFAAVATLLLAIDSEGIFSSTSPRRHLGWLALALATVGLWWRLRGGAVTELWPYVVPLSLALIVIALFIGRSATRATPERDSRVAPLVTLAGLVVTILPLGVNAATGQPLEAVVLFASSAALLLGGSIVTGAPKWQWNADACALAGAIGVIVIAVGRATLLPASSLERDGWLAAVFLSLLIAAFLQTRQHTTGNERAHASASQWLGLAAMTAVLALEVVSFDAETIGVIRALAVVFLFAAIHLIAYWANRVPLSRMLAWVSIAYSGVAAFVAITVEAIHPLEIVTVPIALALLVTGTIHLTAVSNARSWPWLGPGTAILLVPSLLATIDERPIWRLVGLGAIGVAVIVIAVVRRLQAPFVIGVVIVLWHGIATFLPQLREAYAFFPWWLWLGLGGVLLIVLAARYEQRIRNLKSVAMRFAALR